jgi:hypothetical protein
MPPNSTSTSLNTFIFDPFTIFISLINHLEPVGITTAFDISLIFTLSVLLKKYHFSFNEIIPIVI